MMSEEDKVEGGTTARKKSGHPTVGSYRRLIRYWQGQALIASYGGVTSDELHRMLVVDRDYIPDTDDVKNIWDEVRRLATGRPNSGATAMPS